MQYPRFKLQTTNLPNYKRQCGTLRLTTRSYSPSDYANNVSKNDSSYCTDTSTPSTPSSWCTSTSAAPSRHDVDYTGTSRRFATCCKSTTSPHNTLWGNEASIDWRVYETSTSASTPSSGEDDVGGCIPRWLRATTLVLNIRLPIKVCIPESTALPAAAKPDGWRHERQGGHR